MSLTSVLETVFILAKTSTGSISVRPLPRVLIFSKYFFFSKMKNDQGLTIFGGVLHPMIGLDLRPLEEAK